MHIWSYKKKKKKETEGENFHNNYSIFIRHVISSLILPVSLNFFYYLKKNSKYH